MSKIIKIVKAYHYYHDYNHYLHVYIFDILYLFYICAGRNCFDNTFLSLSRDFRAASRGTKIVAIPEFSERSVFLLETVRFLLYGSGTPRRLTTSSQALQSLPLVPRFGAGTMRGH